MGGSIALAALFVLFYTGRSPVSAADLRVSRGAGTEETVPERPFHVSHRLHPRFPDDFPLPSFFVHDHSRGHARHGALTIRFRFRGDPTAAVADLATVGRDNSWEVEQRAPHRLVFRKGERTVEAWFSFPGRSLVLDVPDPR